LDIFLEIPIPINKGPKRCGHMFVGRITFLWCLVCEHRAWMLKIFAPTFNGVMMTTLALEGNGRRSLAQLLPKHARLSLKRESDR